MIISKNTARLAAPAKGWILAHLAANFLLTAAGVFQIYVMVRLMEALYLDIWLREDLLWTALALGGVILARFILNIFMHRASFRIASHIRTYLRDKFYSRILELELGYMKRFQTSSLVSLCVDGVEALEMYFGRYLPQLLFTMLVPFALFIYLSRIHFPSALVLFLAVPLIPLSIVLIGRWARRVTGVFWDSYEQLSAHFLESLQGLTTLKIFNRDGERAGELEQLSWSFRNATMRLLRMQLTSITVMDLIGLGSIALAILLAARDLANASLSIGGAITVLLISGEFFRPLRLLGSYYHAGMNGVMAGEKMLQFLDADKTKMGQDIMAPKLAGNGEESLKMPEGAIIFDNVSFAYEEGRPALQHFNLVMEEGRTIALVGESGSGKSTAAYLLARLFEPDEGEISWGDTPLGKFSKEELRQNIALVSQNTFIFAGTLAENLRLAKEEASGTELMEACHKAGLARFVMSLPLGLDTQVGELGGQLSGGQKQRLSLARAVLKDARLLIFDEATSNIDARSEEQLWQALHALALNKTTLIISHRLSTLKNAHKIVLMQNGRIMEEGSHDFLMAHGGLYQTMLKEQQELEAYGKDVV